MKMKDTGAMNGNFTVVLLKSIHTSHAVIACERQKYGSHASFGFAGDVGTGSNDVLDSFVPARSSSMPSRCHP